MADLKKEVRVIENLYRSWAIVRRNVMSSGKQKFKDEIQKISENPIPHLKRIQGELQKDGFVFLPQKGVKKKKKSGGYRLVVVSPINNRIVQRAILNVLQTSSDRDPKKIVPALGNIQQALFTPTSVGGIPTRGVEYAMGLIRQAIADGATHFLRSDIKDFFTLVPKSTVVDFVREETKQDAFANLFNEALQTELENAEEVKELINLPATDIGVPQGSSLSAFAANVVLQNFDSQMNGRGIVTIRYIDDFVILGKSVASVKKAFQAGNEILKSFNMLAYDPADNSDKAGLGKISEGFDFLGCTISDKGIVPSKKSCRSIVDKVEKIIGSSLESIQEMISEGRPRRAEDSYLQTLTLIDRKVRGWGDSFDFCDGRLPFHQIDDKLDSILLEYEKKFHRATKDASIDIKRRASGVALLKDTPKPLLGDK